ncbi:TIGR03960 family B12-binding radical SAM protein [Eubacterium sp. An11]|uniref:TIGR03960 family B12-binding radical SAM protein n=1 Tax=Eubacterium sp. An11 TaxID=1965542 RepID=UPI001FA89830|nr:TIGR03960 family B12-binding radical SAM protein [Eubacterium sp. An11]
MMEMMNTTDNLALKDEILLSIEKPVRYIGHEINSVIKDPDAVDIRVGMAFPDVYEIGMSHLGMKIIYEQLNRREDIWCERVFSPWVDLDKVMREEKIPLFALESQDPVFMFDFLLITIQYEMCYTNILQLLDLAQIGIFAKDRREDAPFVIGGGPCTYNPEPLAPFFDMFYIGESETVYYELMDLYKEHKAQGGSRKEFLKKAARVPGIYVPSLYDVEYHEDGTIASMEPNCPEAPVKILRQVQMDLDNTFYPEKPLVPYIKVTQDRCVLEIQRGCTRGCRFCQAGMVYRPLRERSLSMLERVAENSLKATGNDEISLSSLSSSDYRELPELCNYLIDNFRSKNINIALPSLRIDAFSLDVMSKVQDVRKSSLTFAPEAGTQRMRDVINKGLTEEDILHGAEEAFKGGWNKVKLYFMMGLPTETEEDMKGIAHLCEKVAMHYYKLDSQYRNGRVSVGASCSFFVPKPFTPFQWASMCEVEEYNRRAHLVNDEFKAQHNRRSLSFKYHDAKTTVLEGILARGDRRIADVIYSAYQKGCLYDAWTEFFHYDRWMEAMEENGLDYHFYTTRERNLDEIFPWDFIDISVTKEFLKREWNNAMEEKVTPNCREKCSGCGASRFGGGVCRESKN